MLVHNKIQSKKIQKDIAATAKLLDFEQNLYSSPELAEQLIDELATEANPGTAEVAMLQKIGIALKAEEWSEASNLLSEAADNPHYSALTRSLAALSWLNLNLHHQANSLDETEAEKLVNRYSSDMNIFRGSAKIIASLWYAKKNNQQQAKETLYSVIQDKTIVASIRDQAQSILNSLEAVK